MDESQNDKLLEFEKLMVENFVFRNASKLVNKSPLDVLLSYVEWRHNRYTVIDGGGAFLVMDIYSSDEPIAIFDKEANPDAFNHAWDMCEKMNDLPDEYISVDGKMFAQEDFSNDDSEFLTNKEEE